MVSLAPELERAALAAREHTLALARTAAGRGALSGAPGAERLLAAAAGSALFGEALLAALKARFAEFRLVTK